MLSFLLVLSVTYAGLAANLPALFASEQDALTFPEIFDSKWHSPSLRTDFVASVDGFDMKLFEYRLDGTKGYVVVGTGPTGKIGFYEVRFPSIDDKCIGTPDTRALATSLLTQFERGHAPNARDVNLIAGLGDVVWPIRGASSGPSALVGQTWVSFFKWHGYCSFQVFRRPAAVR